MKAFGRLAFISTLATYLLIFVGGLVRVAGAGMGCPDWPKCFGRWIPPLSKAQIPMNIDPASFNITLAWIEYVNRLIGVTVGLLIAATAVLALWQVRRYARLLYPTLAAALLVAFQGWQGSQVVASELQPMVITLHLFLALVIASLLTYVTQEAYYLNHSLPGERSLYPERARIWVGVLWLGGIVQVILGTQVRGGAETIAARLPLLTSSELLAKVGVVHNLHMLVGILTALLTVYVGVSLLRLSTAPSVLVRQSVVWLMILVLAQIALGLMMLINGLGALLQLFHLWLSAFYIGFVLVLYSAMRRRREHLAESTHAFRRVALATVAGVVVLTVIAFGVVQRAEASRADIPIIKEVPPFTFVEQDGQPFGLEQMKGKLTVVDFFFTSCRGVCPAMIPVMRELYDMYASSDKVQFVSVSVDPDTDTPPVMKEYAEAAGVFDDRWRFIRSESMEQVRWLAREGFLVSDDLPQLHSTKLILVDTNGNIRGYYEYSDAAAQDLLKQHIKVLARSL